MIAGFEQPDEGEILIGGVDAVGTPPYKRDVNTVFQQYALFPHMSVLDNVAYGLKQRSVGKAERHARPARRSSWCSSPAATSTAAAQLSGGQQQRVALARALVMNPRVLLLDEPLGALDLKLRKEMQIELKRIQQQVGITFVYVTHDQEEALSMSDRIAVMSNGGIEQLDEPRVIYDRPTTAVRGGLHRRHELPRRAGRRGRRTAATRAEPAPAMVVRGRGAAAARRAAAASASGPSAWLAHPRAGRRARARTRARAEVITKMYLGDQMQLVAQLRERRQRRRARAAGQRRPGARRDRTRATGSSISWDETAPLLLATPTLPRAGSQERQLEDRRSEVEEA